VNEINRKWSNVIIMTQYTLIRSNRKTAAIYVRNGAVAVRAPHKMPKRDIDNFIVEKEQWILKSLAKQRTQAENKNSFMVDYGSVVSFRGNYYKIIQRSGTMAGFDGEVFYLPFDLTPEQIKATCVQIYKRLAKAYIISRVVEYASRMNATPKALHENKLYN